MATLIVSVAVAALISYWAAASITETWMVEHGSLFSIGEDDLQAQVTQEALAIKQSGASGCLLTIAGHLESNRFLRKDWDRLEIGMDGFSPQVTDLRTPFQTIYESFALVDQVPWSACCQAILIVIPEMFSREANAHSEMEDRSKLGVRSIAATVESIRRGAPAVPLRGNYFIDNQSYLISRAPFFARNYIGQKLGWQQERADMTPRDRHGREVAVRDSAVMEANTSSFRRLLQRLHFRGFQTVTVVYCAGETGMDSDLRWCLQSIAENCGAQFRVLLPTEATIAGIPRELLMDLKEQTRGE